MQQVLLRHRRLTNMENPPLVRVMAKVDPGLIMSMSSIVSANKDYTFGTFAREVFVLVQNMSDVDKRHSTSNIS